MTKKEEIRILRAEARDWRRAEEKCRKKYFSALEEVEKHRREATIATRRAQELETEVMKLKARLYDFMTAGK